MENFPEIKEYKRVLSLKEKKRINKLQTQALLIRLLLISNLIFIMTLIILGTYFYLTQKELNTQLQKAQDDILVMNSKQPEAHIRFLQPVSDYTEEDQEIYKLPPLPKL